MKSCLGRNMEQREGELQQWRNTEEKETSKKKNTYWSWGILWKSIMLKINLRICVWHQSETAYFRQVDLEKAHGIELNLRTRDFQRFWIIVPLSKTLDSKLFFRDCPLTELYSSVCGCDNISKSDVSALNNWFWSHPLSEQTDNCHALIYMCVPAYKDWLLQTHQR